MAGNELNVCKFLIENLTQIEAPLNKKQGYITLTLDNYLEIILTSNAYKKADIYLNRQGISLKQTGGSFSFNRLQRAEIRSIFDLLNFNNSQGILNEIDRQVSNYHQGNLPSRNLHWSHLFSVSDFQNMLEFLMMRGSPNHGLSDYPADYILEAPAFDLNINSLQLYTFQEYFTLYQDSLTIAIRRQWIGQKSNSEHKRALSISKKSDNQPWVFLI